MQNLNMGGQNQSGKNDKSNQLHSKLWYYGPITRAQCDDILNQRGHDGDFLIRDSETNVSIRLFYTLIFYFNIIKLILYTMKIIELHILNSL